MKPHSTAKQSMKILQYQYQPTTTDDQENVNVTFQNIGINRRRTPRKKKKKEKNKSTIEMSKTRPKMTIHNDDSHHDDHLLHPVVFSPNNKKSHNNNNSNNNNNNRSIQSFSSNNNNNNNNTTISNENISVDIPDAFIFHNNEDENDDNEDSEEEEPEYQRHRRKRSTMRRSNALNEDRYDFCLVIDTKEEEDQENEKKKCCACLSTKKTAPISNTTKKDADVDAVVVNVSPKTRSKKSLRQQDDQKDKDQTNQTQQQNDDPATQFDNGPMQRLRTQRRNARRKGALRGEDDDDTFNTSPRVDDDDDDAEQEDEKEDEEFSSSKTNTKKSKKSKPNLFTTTDGDETISVEHTGLGLHGMRMVSLIRAKLRHAGLRVKRVQNLTGTRTLLKVRAEQQRLEEEAERMRLVMRTKDGGYARFKQKDRHVFCGSGYHSESNDHVLFRSSDRQSILLHIIKSNRNVGGAQLSRSTKKEPCGDAIKLMFPVHMVLRLRELRRTWSTACFCCRTQALSRYNGHQSRKGREFQQSDAGNLLITTPFPFTLQKNSKNSSKNSKDEDLEDDHLNSNVGDCNCKRCFHKCCSMSTLIDVLTFGWLVRQPLDAISEYFGETIGFYFAFLEFYTTWLALPTAAGIILFCFQVYEARIDHWLLPYYSLFVGLWSMLFLVRWRRRRVELAYRWGVMDHEEEEIERVEFNGVQRISSVTGGEEKYYNPSKRLCKQICCTFPITITWLVSVVTLMLYLFTLRDGIMDKFKQNAALNGSLSSNSTNSTNTTFSSTPPRNLKSSNFLNFETMKTPGMSMSLSLEDRYEYGGDLEFWLYLLIPPMMAGMMIPILNKLYLILATKLNNWENHKTESEHQYHLIAKVLSFRMINCFCSLYYYAFSGRHPILRLTVQLASFMIVGQLRKHAIAILYPCIKQTCLSWLSKREVRAAAKKLQLWENEKIKKQNEIVDEKKINQIKIQVETLQSEWYVLKDGKDKEKVWKTYMEMEKLMQNMEAQFEMEKKEKEKEHCIDVNDDDDDEEEEERKKKKGKKEKKDKKNIIPLSNRRILQAEEEAWNEARMTQYNTFNDYAEMMVQYGYVTFFSMAFPLAPGLALLNNIVEIRSDAFKLCNNTRRPVARKAAGIGVWFNTLQLMSIIAVMTNLAHIGFTSDQFKQYFPNVTNSEKVVIIFGFEHVILLLQWILTTLVPDAPFWVRNSIKREKHLSKERLHEKYADDLINNKIY